MSSNLLAIGASAANAAQTALQITGENIANASTDGYVRRSVEQSELDSTTKWGSNVDVSMSGVLVTGVTRNADAFAQAEVRRTASNTARAEAQVSGLTSVSNAVEQSGVYTAITNFVGSLQTLSQDPTSASSRSSVMTQAQTMVSAFQIASQELTSAQASIQSSATDGVTQVNTLASALAETNAELTTSSAGSNDQASLLDQRDALLKKLSKYTDYTTSFGGNGTVTVTLGATSTSSGTDLVSGVTAAPLTMAADSTTGALSFKVGTSDFTPAGGSLAGNQQTIATLYQTQTNLDQLAANVASTVNSQQVLGTDYNGDTGAALFSGTTAAGLTLTTTDGSKIAAAATTTTKGSADGSNLATLNSTLSTSDPAGQMDSIIYTASSAVSSMTTTYNALKTISDGAATTLSSQSGVDTNTEAVNLVQYQQAFEAAGQVMKTAATIFQSLLSDM